MGQDVIAREAWDRALGVALEATADELAAALPADAVERALANALANARASGDLRAEAELANALHARQRARAETVDLAAERARRAGKGRP